MSREEFLACEKPRREESRHPSSLMMNPVDLFSCVAAQVTDETRILENINSLALPSSNELFPHSTGKQIPTDSPCGSSVLSGLAIFVQLTMTCCTVGLWKQL
jgi:hypothetical protein